MKLRSGRTTGPSTATTTETAEADDQQQTDQADISKNKPNDEAPSSSAKTNVTTRAQAKKAAANDPPASGVKEGTAAETKEVTVALEDKKDQASSKSSASTSLRGKAKADSSTPACSAEGRSKAASSISADLRASSSPGTPSEPTVPSLSKKRKAPSKQLAEQPTKKRSRTVPQTDELVASGELNKESLPDHPPPETTTSTNVSDGSSTLTPPEDIPLPNLPECNVCWETGKEYVQTCAYPQLTCTECLQHALAESLNSKHIDQIDCLTLAAPLSGRSSSSGSSPRRNSKPHSFSGRRKPIPLSGGA